MQVGALTTETNSELIKDNALSKRGYKLLFRPVLPYQILISPQILKYRKYLIGCQHWRSFQEPLRRSNPPDSNLNEGGLAALTRLPQVNKQT